jgi:hypothetical protein
MIKIYIFLLQKLIKTTKRQKGKRNENYFLRKKVPVASLRRISKRSSEGNDQDILLDNNNLVKKKV